VCCDECDASYQIGKPTFHQQKTLKPMAGRSGKMPQNFPVKIGKKDTLVRIYAPTENYPNFRVAWRERRLCKKTGQFKKITIRKDFKTYSLAKKFAEEKHAKLKIDHISIGSLSNEQIIEYQQALKIVTAKGSSILIALREWEIATNVLPDSISISDAARKVLKNTQLPKKSVLEASEEYLNFKNSHVNEKYFRSFEATFKKFNEKFQCDVNDLEDITIHSFLKKLKLTSKTKNNYRTVINSFLSWCKDKGYLNYDSTLPNLISRIKFLETGKIDKKEVYTPEQMRAILKNANENLKIIFCLVGFCGLRTSEALKWTISSIKNDQIHVDGYLGTKNIYNRNAYYHKKILNSITEYSSINNTLKLPVYLKDDDYQKEKKKLLDKLKITPVRNGFRNSFISYLLLIDPNIDRVATWSGNTPTVIHRNYKELVSKKDALEWFNLNIYFKSKNT
jgi:integrase